MKQYRYTSADFVPQGETGDPDAVMNAQDLQQLKKLAGLVTEGGIAAIPQVSDDGVESPVGSNVSQPAEDRRQLEREYGARPGTDLWFIINFTKPYMNGSLRQHVEDYLKKHPEYRLKQHPGE